MSALMENWWAQDIALVLVLGVAGFLLVLGFRNEQWRRAGLRFRRDRIGVVSLLVVSVYLAIGLLEMIQIPHEKRGRQSLLEAITSGIPEERRFSAPLATHTFT